MGLPSGTRQAHDHVLNKLQQEHNLIEESDEDDSEYQQVNHDDSEP